MSMLLRRLSSLGLGKPHVSVRSSLLLHSRGFSTSLLQTPPCRIVLAEPCGGDLGKLVVMNLNELECKDLEKKVPLELVDDEDSKIIIGASGGWIATLKEDGVLRLQDDFNPVASDTNPKRIPLPPLVTLPHCQTKIITNVSVSSSSPEDDEDCVVAIKFLGPQLSFCKPAGKSGKPEWTNIKIENPCFYSSRVMFSKKDNMFRIPGSGGHLIGSWDPYKPSNNPTFQRSEHLVESRPTGETFLVKQYKKTIKITKAGIARMRTKTLMVYKLDDEGNAVYTQDIGDLNIFLSLSEPFCVPATSFPDLLPNSVDFIDFDESGFVCLKSTRVWSRSYTCSAPFYIPPQHIIKS
ncbi:PREDICTED: uncharacterized protein LOC106327315 isoform X2 [Brassica oleracea var. oleracea]|uniref:uncharacterized protein LOC106327315 isoform X2 n=1 Tax=Brassica oleracea var. oleracea TaxID=109376 RepID=UPI0006A74996|nr:PREDICTED: uncharacterized protein LOC106327315 isoform X2 [Brassica oleracea var. oleracea]